MSGRGEKRAGEADAGGKKAKKEKKEKKDKKDKGVRVAHCSPFEHRTTLDAHTSKPFPHVHLWDVRAARNVCVRMGDVATAILTLGCPSVIELCLHQTEACAGGHATHPHLLLACLHIFSCSWCTALIVCRVCNAQRPCQHPSPR
jgi:hypothetical protein